jgi:diguanylate cyclase (GGDEF)-like protein/PAS domain S-box-containing protein
VTPLTLEAVVEVAPEALVVFDDRGMVTLANRAARELAGRAPLLAAALSRERPLHSTLVERARSSGEAPGDWSQATAFTCAFESTDSETLWIAVRLSAMRATGEDSARTVCSLRDVSDQRRREAELTHHALHDPLTGLPNLRLVREHFKVALARARRGEQAVGLLFLDVNGLKLVNDELGHHAGDALLIEFAGRLTGAVRACDPVGRLPESSSLVGRKGGDEFVVILTDLARDPRTVMEAVTCRLEEALGEPLVHGSHEIRLSAAIGGAAYPCDGNDAESLLEHANAAMRRTKRAEADSRTER